MGVPRISSLPSRETSQDAEARKRSERERGNARLGRRPTNLPPSPLSLPLSKRDRPLPRAPCRAEPTTRARSLEPQEPANRSLRPRMEEVPHARPADARPSRAARTASRFAPRDVPPGAAIGATSSSEKARTRQPHVVIDEAGGSRRRARCTGRLEDQRQSARPPSPSDLPPFLWLRKRTRHRRRRADAGISPKRARRRRAGSPRASARADAGISSRRPASPRRKRKRCTAASASSSSVRRAPQRAERSEDKMQKARQSRSARSLELLLGKIPAASYSPTRLPVQYHRLRRA